MMSIPLKVKVIEASRQEFDEFATLLLYYLGKDGIGKLVYASVRCKIQLVEGLRANLLIGNNIMSSENFIIDIEKKTPLIWSYGDTIPISIRQ